MSYTMEDLSRFNTRTYTSEENLQLLQMVKTVLQVLPDSYLLHNTVDANKEVLNDQLLKVLIDIDLASSERSSAFDLGTYAQDTDYSTECYTYALVLVFRLFHGVKGVKGIKVTKHMVHVLYVCLLCIAQKLQDDDSITALDACEEFYMNLGICYSDTHGKQFELLEGLILKQMDYRVHVSEPQYTATARTLRDWYNTWYNSRVRV